MTAQPLNLYGDKFVPTTGKHGSNISEQRVDELDQACLDFVKACVAKGHSCQAVDIGGGSGAQSKRMAGLGASVLLIDLSDQRKNIDDYNEGLGRSAIEFIQCDVRKIEEWPESLNCIYSQRMLGSIPYSDVLRLLAELKSKALSQASLFVSVGGLNTEYGADYPDRDKSVEMRFASFSPGMAAKHGIHIPQCLYREEELVQLVEKAGWNVQRSWTSAFGNPKVIAQVK